MAVLCWMAVTLSLLLSAGNSLADVDQNQLAGIVQEVLNRYTPSYVSTKGTSKKPLFSLAVSIPFNRDRNMYDISQVTDTGDEVTKQILSCEVYASTRVVAATVLRWPNVLEQCPKGRVPWNDVLSQCGKESMTWEDVPKDCPAVYSDKGDHAEYRTLKGFNTLVQNHNKDDLLLFYIRSSPCAEKCTSETDPSSILDSINQILKWDSYAVVFTNLYKPGEGNIPGSLERLGNHKGPLGSIGLKNIFRCNGEDAIRCESCSSGEQVNPFCVTDVKKPKPVQQPKQGRSGSPSKSGQGDRGKQSKGINPSAGVSTNVDSNRGGGQRSSSPGAGGRGKPKSR